MSIREIMLITVIIALACPYIYALFGKFFLSDSNFHVTHAELLGWLQKSDASTVSLEEGSAEGDFDEQVFLKVERKSPSNDAVVHVQAGVLQKLKDEGWDLRSHRFSMGPNRLEFYFRKGKTSSRLYVIEIPSRAYTPGSREASTYLVIAVRE